MTSQQFKFGGYPAGYNPAQHGPYDPSRYYGKPDTPFLNLKLGEITSWFGRREKTPQALMGACSRAFWRWQMKYVQPRKCGVAPFYQVIGASMIFFYMINHKKLRHHKNYKYH